MKKIISIVLCVALALAISAPALAAFDPPASPNDSPIGQGYVTSGSAVLYCFIDGQYRSLSVNVGDTFLVYSVSGAFANVYMTSGNLSGYGGSIKTSTIYYYLYGGMQVVSDPVG